MKWFQRTCINLVVISCCDASPTIRNCTIGSNGPNAIEFWEGCELPTIIACTILGQLVEVNDPTLVAYWSLDETEGDIAYDSAGDNDGYAVGDPLWQPDGGQVDGAIQLDGVDDFISIGLFVLNPADGEFSVFAWVKGGAPGQTVISQIGKANWLCTDSVEGNLMTELKSDRFGPMVSQTNITDGNWHRIGCVWDGSHITLCVDSVAVAEDPHAGLDSSTDGLRIGAGKMTRDRGSFFSGLIDDVCIYNRAVHP